MTTTVLADDIPALLVALRCWYHNGNGASWCSVSAKYSEAVFEKRFAKSGNNGIRLMAPALVASALRYVAETIGERNFVRVVALPTYEPIDWGPGSASRAVDDPEWVGTVAAIIFWLDSHVGVEFMGADLNDSCSSSEDGPGLEFDPIPVVYPTSIFSRLYGALPTT